jgi:iron complex outermembrane receptor protein
MTNAPDSRLRRRIRCLLYGATVLAAAAHGAPAVAEDAAPADALEEVTVTAQRRPELERDVPISMTVFTAAQIENQNFLGVESYFADTPNVSFTSEGTRDRKELSLRGISDQLSPDNNIREGSFGFYIDDFNVAQGTSNPEIVDIDRIEILRGPQGTYFGRNSVGGAVNITTKQPTNDFFAEAGVQYSSFNTVDSHAIVNLPLVDDLLALRIVGRDETSDGNIKNINPIGGGNNNKYTYGKIILRFTPNENLTIDTTGVATREVVGMRDGVPSGVLGDFSASALYPGQNGLGIPDGVGFYPNNVTNVNFNRPQEDGTQFNYVSNRIKWNADAFTVTNVIGYLYSNEFEGGDIDGSSYDYFYETESIQRTSLSEELRVQSNPGKLIDWTGGFYYAHDLGNTSQFTYAGADAAALFGVPSADLPSGSLLTSSPSNSSDLSTALFGEAVYHFDPKTSFTLGARVTRETVGNIGYNTTAGGIAYSAFNGKSTYTNLSPHFAATYAASDQVNLYATIARGFKAGGIEAAPPPSTNDYYSPETLWNYEAGMKADLWDRRLRLDADVFYMDWKDIQADYAIGETVNGAVSFISGVANAASAKSYGFETEATALVLPKLTVGGGAGYDRAYYVSYPDAETGIGTQGNLSGATLPNSPKWTLHADSQYNEKFASGDTGFLRLEWYYRGGIVPDQNSEFHTGFPWDVPSYNIWNLRAGYTRQNWTVTVFDENFLNTKYYTNAYEKAFATGMFVEPGYRNIGVRLTVKTK